MRGKPTTTRRVNKARKDVKKQIDQHRKLIEPMFTIYVCSGSLLYNSNMFQKHHCIVEIL